MIDKEEVRLGRKFRLSDDFGSDFECIVCGFDPLENKWIIASKDFVIGLSHLEDNDYKNMELVTE